MKILKYLSIIICFCLIPGSCAYPQVFSFEADTSEYTATFPKGTMIKATIQNTVSSKDNQVGDRVTFVIESDIIIGKATCIPEGSFMYGKIIQLANAAKGRDGYFQILVDKLVFPDGWQTQMSAKVWTKDGTGIVGGGVTRKQEYRKIPHHIEHIGPVVQLIRTGERAMGQERALLAGTNVLIVLERDLQVKYLKSFE